MKAEVVQRVVRGADKVYEFKKKKKVGKKKEKANVFLILSITCNNEGARALRYDTPGAGSILKAYNSLIIFLNSHQILAAVCHRQAGSSLPVGIRPILLQHYCT